MPFNFSESSQQHTLTPHDEFAIDLPINLETFAKGLPYLQTNGPTFLEYHCRITSLNLETKEKKDSSSPNYT
jgi:hypothetical protein